jgi:hypothetical protein
MVEDTHQAQKMFRGNGVVDLMVLEKFVGRFDEK